MNRILFHSLTIPPDQVSTGKLVAEIASKFKEKNINIEILASMPQYRFDSSEFTNEGFNTLDATRIEILNSAKEIIIANPLVGTGSGSFPIIYEFQTGFWKGHSHNLPIESNGSSLQLYRLLALQFFVALYQCQIWRYV